MIPKTIQKATSINPKKLLIFGKTKVGKTTKLSELGERCLIIDTEEGTDFIDARKIVINNLDELRSTYSELSLMEKQEIIAIDTIDKIYDWIVDDIIAVNNVKNLSDIGFGGGFDQARNRLINFCENLSKCCKTLIIVGHLKRTIIGETSIQVDLKSLDLPGKAKNMLASWADAVGYIYRDDNSLRVSFVPTSDIEAGTRIKHLTGKDIEFDWNLIFVNN